MDLLCSKFEETLIAIQKIVYILQCSICQEQYVGETKNSFRERLNGHRSKYNTDLRNNSNDSNCSPLAVHFTQKRHEFKDLNFAVVKSHFRDNIDRKCFESFLIHKLNSYNNGMNQCPGIFKTY